MGLLDAKRFYVFGLGKSGIAVSLLLVEKGFDVVAFDDSEVAIEGVDPKIAVTTPSHCVSSIAGYMREHPVVMTCLWYLLVMA